MIETCAAVCDKAWEALLSAYSQARRPVLLGIVFLSPNQSRAIHVSTQDLVMNRHLVGNHAVDASLHFRFMYRQALRLGNTRINVGGMLQHFVIHSLARFHSLKIFSPAMR